MNIKDLLRTIAPVIGTAIGSPLGGLALGALSKILLGHDGGSQDDINQALLSASPEKIAEIIIADKNFQAEMYKTEVDDRKDARKYKDWFVQALAFIIIGGFLSVIYCLFFDSTPPTDKEVLLVLLGNLSGMAYQVVSFYFGSSSSSRGKDDSIAEMAKK